MKAYELGLYEKAMPARLSWEQRLTTAKELGFDYLEISIDETVDRLGRLQWTRQQRRELVQWMDRTGLPIRSMCLSAHRKYPMGSHQAETRKRSMEIMADALLLAADLGLRTIQLAGYDVYYETADQDTRSWFRENLQRAAEMAAAQGICLGFETMETEFMNTVGKAMEHVHAVGSPYLGVYPDLGNITNAAKSYGTEVSADLRLGQGHLLAMHLKETVPGVFREVPFGTGHVDFQSGITTAWELGVRRYVVEMWDTGKEDWQSDIAFAAKKMSAILTKTEGYGR